VYFDWTTDIFIFAKKSAKMVGILKKVKQVLKFIQNYSPYLDTIQPGLGTFVNSLANVTDDVVDRGSHVYDSYIEQKKKSKKYSIKDGLNDFFTTPATKLAKDYGDIHPRLKLKSENEESDEGIL
jgi:hypothetical protein